MKLHFTKHIVKALSVIGLSAISFVANADPVDVSTAKKVAFTQLKQITSGVVTTRSSEDLELVYQAGKLVKDPYFYVFNSNDKFVIVAGDDKALPILGYSDEGAFDPNNIPPNMAEFLKGYEDEINYARTSITTRSSELKSMWDKMINGEIDQAAKNNQGKTQTTLDKGSNTLRSYSIGEYLVKTQWSQGEIWNGGYIPGYNKYCPTGTPTGCVATAMGQIIGYWGITKGTAPSHGYGQYSYTHTIYGVLSADFEKTTYDYTNMPISLSASSTDTQIEEIAKLLYHCGVSVSMKYAPGGSAASCHTAANSLKNYFGYKNAEYKQKVRTVSYDGGVSWIKEVLYTDAEWINLIKNEINNERPILYSGYGNGEGHAFICDGYKEDNSFHFNWGWDGWYDGFFTLSALTPDDCDFSNDNEAIINIEPEPIILPTSIALNPSDTILRVSKTANLKFKISPDNATNKSVTWTTSNENIVTVSNSGVIKAIASGTATVTATTVHAGKMATCTVLVPIDVASVSVNPTTKSIVAGQTTTLIASVLPDNAYDKTLSWSSSNTSVASVATNGVVSGVAAGTATITVKSKYDNSKLATATITVTPAPILVSGITLNKATTSIKKGNTEALSTTIAPTTATEKGVTWTSSDENIATVDENGVITAVAKGNATITATAKDGSGKTASCAVTVTIPVTSITLNKDNASLNVGETESLTFNVLPADANVITATWKSNNTSIATVSGGTVTAVAPGTAKIIVVSDDNSEITDTCTITVKQPVTGISVSPTTLEMTVGDSPVQLTEAFTPANATNKNVTWTSDDTNIATVSSDGKVTAIKGGTATITVKTQDGNYTATCVITVKQPVTSVTLSQSTLTMKVGDTPITLTETVLPTNATNKDVTWSSDKAYVTVVNGIVTPVSKGTATITVTTHDGNKTATCMVTVIQPVTGVSLNKTSTSIVEHGFETLTPTVAPDNANNQNVTWSSDNASVATVDVNGKITANSIGTATITVTTVDGSYIATCDVTVTAAPISVTGISVAPTSLTLKAGGATSTIVASITPTTATNQNIIWTSSNNSVATVSNGVVTPLAKGLTTITAKSEDGNYTATCDITVEQLVTSITLDQTTVTIAKGSTKALTANVLPTNANDPSIIWTTSNSSIATVSNGTITAVGKGTATITATAADGSGITANCAVTVTQPVEGITLNPTSANLKVGETANIMPSISPSNANNSNIIWSTDNANIATVTNGIITATGKGTATITATAADGSGITANCAVTVTQQVTGVQLSNNAITIANGGSTTLTATVQPTNANNTNVSWTSDNPNITVDASGNISASAKGTATITVTTQDGNFTATCTVTAIQLVTGITISPTTANMKVGDTETVSVTAIAPSDADNQNVTWSSSNTSIATVSASGLITAIGKGTATITATAADGSNVTADCAVTVTQPVTGVSLNKHNTKINVGSTDALTATILPTNANIQTVTWSSDDNSIATVDASGNVTAVAVGITNIKVTTTDGSFVDNCSVEVTIPVTSVSLDPTSISMYVGNDATLTPIINPTTASNQNVSWSSSNTAIATVNANGKVVGIAPGTANVTVTTEDGSKTATCVINVYTVTPPVVGVTNVSLNKSATSIEEGEWEVLSATISPSDAANQNVTWTSSNPSVANVSSSGNGAGYQLGKVTALSTGTTTITVRTDDGGYTASCTVTVVAGAINVTGVTLNTTSLSLAVGSSQAIVETIIPSNATNQSVTWSSDNTYIATVNAYGRITGVNNGTAHITVTTDDGGYTETCTVTVNALNVAVSGISINNPGSSSLAIGNKMQMNVTVNPSNATNKNVTWTSSDNSIATINSNGVITAVGEGTVSITATSQDGSHTAVFTLTVTAATGIEEVQELSIWSYNSKIYVNTPVATEISIYNLAGTLVHQAKIPEGEYVTEINRGTYIVTVGNNLPVKVYVK